MKHKMTTDKATTFCLILKLFLVICKAQSNSDDVTKEYKDNDLEWLKDQEIAIPKGHWKKDVMTPPNSPPNKTKIDIEMSAVEIIDFDVKMQQFTIRVDLEINWSETRLLLANSSLVNGWLKTSNYHAWSPQIDIQSVVISVSWIKKHKIEVKMDYQSEASKWCQYGCDLIDLIYFFVQSSSVKMTFSLTTTVKCSMDFDMFPFDSHICKLVVSSVKKIFLHTK